MPLSHVFVLRLELQSDYRRTPQMRSGFGQECEDQSSVFVEAWKGSDMVMFGSGYRFWGSWSCCWGPVILGSFMAFLGVRGALGKGTVAQSGCKMAVLRCFQKLLPIEDSFLKFGRALGGLAES